MRKAVFVKEVSIIVAAALAFSPAVEVFAASNDEELEIIDAEENVEADIASFDEVTEDEINEFEATEDKFLDDDYIDFSEESEEDTDSIYDVESAADQEISFTDNKSKLIPDSAIPEGTTYDMGENLNGQIYKWTSDDGDEHIGLYIYGDGHVISNKIYSMSDYTVYNSYISNITDVVMVDSITEIGEAVFSGCSHLSNVIMPQNLKVIGEDSFSYCAELQSIELPDGLTTIKQGAFHNCTSLTSVVLPKTVTIMSNLPCSSPFMGCSSLTTVTLAEGMEEIPEYAFYGTSVTIVNLPSTLKIIGEESFSQCTDLQSIELPDGLTTIKREAFNYCPSLTSVVIPKTVTTIEESVFSFCTSLTEVTFAEGMIELPANALCGSNVKTVTLPSSLRVIGNNAFCGCDNLQSIELPDGLTTIGDNAFSSCRNLQSIELSDGLKSLGNYAFSYCINLQSIQLPAALTTIGNSAFSNCNSLKTIVIPNAVTAMGENIFEGCINLDEVTFAEGMEEIPANALYCLNGGYVKTVNLPSTLKSIGREAFWNQICLSTINCNNCKPTSIGDSAFNGCHNLKSIELTDELTSIGADAFNSCVSLKTIKLNDGLTTIGEHAFCGCESLTNIVIPKTVANMGENIFSGCTSLTKITFSEGIEEIPAYALSGQYSYTGYIKVVYLPSSIRSIGANAFTTQNHLQIVFYAGSEAMKNQIEISEGNSFLTDAKWIYGTGSEESEKVTYPKSIRSVKIAGLKTTVSYTGKNITLYDIFNTDDKACEKAGWNSVTLYVVDNKTKAKTALIEEYDYTVSIEEKSDIGKVKVTFTGINGYSGTITKTITIKAANVARSFRITVANTVYSKSGATPEVTVYYEGKLLELGRDYTVSYKNNKKASTEGKKAPYVIVKAKGNYAGTSDKEIFTIFKANVSNLQMQVNNITYNAKGKKGYFLIKPNFTYNDQKVTVGKNKDIQATYAYTYAEETTLKDGTERHIGDEVNPKDKLTGPTSIKVTALVDVENYNSNYEGTTTLEYTYNVVK